MQYMVVIDKTNGGDLSEYIIENEVLIKAIKTLLRAIEKTEVEHEDALVKSRI